MRIDISERLCSVCDRPLNSHTIPKKALERFIHSAESIYDDDNTVERYMRSLSKSSRPIAIKGLMKFCWIVHKTPREIVTMKPRKLKMLLEDFESYVCEQYDNPTTYLERIITKNVCLTIAKATKGFIKANGVGFSELEYKSIFNKRLFKMNIPKQRDFTPTKKDIRTVYGHALERDKVLIHFLTNVPLRKSEVADSVTWEKLGDLTKPYPKVDFFDYELKGHGRGKYKGCHLTMIISESLRKELLKWKEREKQRFKDNGIVISDKEFNKLHVFLSTDCIETEEGKKEINPLSTGAISRLFQILKQRSKIPMTCHSVRYYVQDVIHKMHGKDSVWNCFFLGHKLPSIQAIYGNLWNDYDEVLKAFKKVEPYLDLFYDETKIEDQLKLRARQLEKEGKPIEEIIDIIMKERSQMLIQEMGQLKDTMLLEIKKSEKEYKERRE